MEIKLKLERAPIEGLGSGTIIFEDDVCCIAIKIVPCLALCFKAENVMELAHFCYDIGNAHIPLFALPDLCFCIPFETAYQILCEKRGYRCQTQTVVLEPAYRLQTFAIKEPKLKIAPNFTTLFKEST